MFSTVLLISSITKPESSSYFLIFIVSSISSLKITKGTATFIVSSNLPNKVPRNPPNLIILNIWALHQLAYYWWKHCLFWFFALLSKTTHEVVLRIDFFSLLFLVLFLFFFLAADLSLFSCIFVSLTFISSQFLIFYKAAALSCENVSFASLIFSKIIKRNSDRVPSVFKPSKSFSCPTKSVRWIANCLSIVVLTYF